MGNNFKSKIDLTKVYFLFSSSLRIFIFASHLSKGIANELTDMTSMDPINVS